ncbi:MAG: GAF domain-containing protein [Bacteroidales bacterium]|nr:GAF domain-containing protein [Bacteroidales bacterium]
MRNLYLLFSILITCNYSLIGATNIAPQAEGGSINLSTWDFEKNGLVKLHGEWEFYWDTLLNPDDLKNSSIFGTLINIPASWTSKKGGLHNTKGKATYRLIIETGELEGVYGIRLYDIFTASQAWLDGRLIFSAGTPGNSVKTSIPKFAYENIPLILDKAKEKHELVIQVSNYHHTRAGIIKPVFFGRFNQLTNQTKELLILNLLIVGIILIISFNHFMYFFLHKNDRSNLFFSLLCLVMILRNISTGERIITFLFPNIPWSLIFKLDNFSGFGTIPLFAVFLYILFKDEFPKRMLQIIVSIGVLITLFVFITPQLIYGRYRMFFELYILFGGLYLTFYVLLRASLHHREGALLTFIGFFVLYATAINDVLISMSLIHTSEVAPYGLGFYMLVQSYILSRSSASAISDNERLSLELQNEKQFLEERVEERTRELRKQNSENLKHKEELQTQGWFNEGLAKINSVLNNNKDDLKTLSQKLISEIVTISDAKIGAIYLINDDKENPRLEMSGSWSASKEMINTPDIAPGEGLVGACFKDKKAAILSDVSDTFIKLSSGLGETPLKNLVLMPLIANDIPIGVLELASIKPMSAIQLELLEKITESLSSTVHFMQMSEKNIQLLKVFREKESELVQSEEEMRVHLEELQALREEIEFYRSSAGKKK